MKDMKQMMIVLSFFFFTAHSIRLSLEENRRDGCDSDEGVVITGTDAEPSYSCDCVTPKFIDSADSYKCTACSAPAPNRRNLDEGWLPAPSPQPTKNVVFKTEAEGCFCAATKVPTDVQSNGMPCSCAGGYLIAANDENNRNKCTKCPAGKYDQEGMAGSANNGARQTTPCTACPAGKKSANSAAWRIKCDDCPVGKFQSRKAQTECINCPKEGGGRDLDNVNWRPYTCGAGQSACVKSCSSCFGGGWTIPDDPDETDVCSPPTMFNRRVTNVNGKKFDILSPGDFNLISLQKYFKLNAAVDVSEPPCGPKFIKEISMKGNWIGDGNTISVRAVQGVPMKQSLEVAFDDDWKKVEMYPLSNVVRTANAQQVELQIEKLRIVVHANFHRPPRSQKLVSYLNVHVDDLSRGARGMAVGGVLGNDNANATSATKSECGYKQFAMEVWETKKARRASIPFVRRRVTVVCSCNTGLEVNFVLRRT